MINTDNHNTNDTMTMQDIRFLYSGKILKDTDRLSDHLKEPPESQVFTIHMSCSVVNSERSNPESLYQSQAVSSQWSNYGFNYSGLGQDNLYNTDVNQVSEMLYRMSHIH